MFKTNKILTKYSAQNIKSLNIINIKLFDFQKHCVVYTKTGDKGTTSILGGKRLDKDHIIFNLLGDIDELNSYIGLVNF